jgi:hypothetical protein
MRRHRASRGTGRILAAAIAVAGCVERRGGGATAAADTALLRENLLRAAPAVLSNRVQADLDGRIVYLGNDLERRRARPGDTVRVVHYWQVIEPPGPGWKVFTHVLGAGGRDWLNADQGEMRVAHPPARWRAGEIIRDPQSFALPSGWSSDVAEIAVGLYRQGGRGATDRMRVRSGPVDRERYIRAGRIEVERDMAAAPAPAATGNPAASHEVTAPYRIPRAETPPTIDGLPGEALWRQVEASAPFIAAEGGPGASGEARARLAWDERFVYILVEVRDPQVASAYRGRDRALWKEDAVVVFIDADGNGRGYVELGVNPHNARLDCWYPATRREGGQPGWNAEWTSAVKLRGSLDAAGDRDVGWDVEMAIPLAAVRGADRRKALHLPPPAGQRWRVNIVRVDGRASGLPAITAWSPVSYRDFHGTGHMRELRFVAAGRSAGAAPAPDARSAALPR